MSRVKEADQILIVSITPYFLEKGNFWFAENLRKILTARKTQSFFQDNIVFLEKNQKHNPSLLLRRLDELGYEKVLEVSEPGEFSQRGGLVDVFPINSERAFRIEFLGNKIESLLELEIKIEDEKAAKEKLRKRLKSQKLFSDLKGLKPGEYLVHLDHGIGIYRQEEEINNHKYYQLEYAQGDKLYVPQDLTRKLSRYVGFVEPKISRLGSSLWQKTKRKIKEEAEKLAKDLLEIYAKREVAERAPYVKNNEIDKEIREGFSFEETPDQLEAIKDIEEDLESEKPMDRIICGDVGFGKTEIALRALVRAVSSDYQAALICPTTILASQHYQNFSQRLKNIPVRIVLLSRLQTKKEQKEIVNKIREGQIDIVIGTHRLLSKDIDFKNLGLLIIDDEQRFGVKQKEKFKKARSLLDVLSLSATPIPRTLQMALSGVKEMSLITTPPLDRMAVRTFVLPFDAMVVREALLREQFRGGQSFYVCPRISDIDKVAMRLRHFVPEVKFAIAHGGMSPLALENVMSDFYDGAIDLLLCTNIIESGIDITRANTLIIHRADLFGLAQLYQLRGRIGRGKARGYAYLTYPAGQVLSLEAQKRLDVIQSLDSLGAGFSLASHDMDIRGAGNLVGEEQSGHIREVGIELYQHMLEEAIAALKEEKEGEVILTTEWTPQISLGLF